MSAPAVLVVTASLDDLRALVRDELRAALDARRDVPPSTPTPLLSKQQAAAALGISTTTLDRLVRDRGVPYVRVGDVRKFDLVAVRQALAAAEQPPAPTEEPKPATSTTSIAGVVRISPRIRRAR